MIDSSKKFSVHIMQTKPAEADLTMTAIRVRHEAPEAHARDLHGLVAGPECAP